MLATALFVFTNERGFSHEVAGGEWDIAVALAAFLFLLLLASRAALPGWTAAAALACAIVVEGLAAFRMGGLGGAAIVAALVALVPWRAARLGLPPLVLLASFAANYPLVRALADPRHASPLPPLEGFVAVILSVLTLPFVIRDPERRLFRWGTWLVGTGMFGLLTERYFMRVASVVAPDDVLLTLGGATLVLASAFARGPRLGRVVAALGISAMVLTALLLLQGASYVSDSTVSIDEAARDLLRGEDPYVTVDIVEAVHARGLSDDLFTHYADGSGVERRYPYPAGSFLPSAALFALGVHDVRYGFLGALALLYLIVALRAPAALAPYVGAIALVDVMAMRQVALAGVEPTWALFLVLSLVLPRAGGLFAGLATAARQTAWLYVPWLALDRLRQEPRRLAAWLALVLAAFGIVNLAFAIDAPAAWLASVSAPIVSPYEPLGFGVVRFSTDGPFPLAPRAAYTVAMVVAFAASLWTYWRDRATWRYGLAVLPVAPLYVAWRSLQNYFMFAPIFLVSLMAEDPEVRSQRM